MQKRLSRRILRLNRIVWKRLPGAIYSSSLGRAYGAMLHRMVRRTEERNFNFGTHFFRNRPQIKLIVKTASSNARDKQIRMCVLACSKGAEVYSIVWELRSAVPDLDLRLNAVDVSREVVEYAKRGNYSMTQAEFVGAPVFDRITKQEMDSIFDIEGGHAKVKVWLRDGITWHVGDAGDPALLQALGTQDIVVANTFLCHMEVAQAERCLRNLARLVRPGGFLFVSGIDLDVRMKVAMELGWVPVDDLIEEIHYGDPVLIRDWPFRYWGLEPLDRKKPNWKFRYTSTFKIPQIQEVMMQD